MASTNYSWMSDGMIKDIVTNMRYLTIEEAIDQHTWYIFWAKLGLSKRFSKKDLPALREWRDRLKGILEAEKYRHGIN